MKITDEIIQKVLNTLEQNKSDDDVLMNIGGLYYYQYHRRHK